MKITRKKLLILALIFFGLTLVTFFVIKANSVTISNVRVTNLSDTSTTVTWVTDKPITTELMLSESDSFPALLLDKQAVLPDDRASEGNDIPRYTHAVTLKNLSSEKNYYFRLVTGLVVAKTDVSQFTTLGAYIGLDLPLTVFGKVTNAVPTISNPIDGLVLYYVYDASNLSNKSATYSAVLNNDSNWYGNINDVRDSTGVKLALNSMITPTLNIAALTEQGSGSDNVFFFDSLKPVRNTRVNVQTALVNDNTVIAEQDTPGAHISKVLGTNFSCEATCKVGGGWSFGDRGSDKGKWCGCCTNNCGGYYATCDNITRNEEGKDLNAYCGGAVTPTNPPTTTTPPTTSIPKGGDYCKNTCCPSGNCTSGLQGGWDFGDRGQNKNKWCGCCTNNCGGLLQSACIPAIGTSSDFNNYCAAGVAPTTSPVTPTVSPSVVVTPSTQPDPNKEEITVKIPNIRYNPRNLGYFGPGKYTLNIIYPRNGFRYTQVVQLYTGGCQNIALEDCSTGEISLDNFYYDKVNSGNNLISFVLTGPGEVFNSCGNNRWKKDSTNVGRPSNKVANYNEVEDFRYWNCPADFPNQNQPTPTSIDWDRYKYVPVQVNIKLNTAKIPNIDQYKIVYSYKFEYNSDHSIKTKIEVKNISESCDTEGNPCITGVFPGQVIYDLQDPNFNKIDFYLSDNGSRFVCGLHKEIKFVKRTTLPEYAGETDDFTDWQCNELVVLAQGEVPVNTVATQAQDASTINDPSAKQVQGAEIKSDVYLQGVYDLELNNHQQTLVVVEKTANIHYYADQNDNKVKDANEVYISADAIEGKKVEKKEDLEKYNLSSGWNLITFNINDPNAEDSEELVNKLKIANLQANEIAEFVENRWNIYVLKEGTNFVDAYGNKFQIVPGKAYYVKSNTAGSFYLTGQRIDETNKTLKLAEGFNFASFSQGVISANSLTARSLLQECAKVSINCESISYLEFDLYQTLVMKQGSFFGTDYAILADKAYVIKVKGSGGDITFK